MSYHNILTTVSELEIPTKTMGVVHSIAAATAKVTILYPFKSLCSMGLGYSLPSVVKKEQQQLLAARTKLANIVKQQSIDQFDAEVALGSSKKMIIQRAKKMGADLIIIDVNQPKNDKYMINSLFSKAPCDILVVRNPIRKKDETL